MIGDDVYEVDPWSIPERRLQLDLLPQSESVFALSNGHFGLRGNLDEGEPAGQAGTYLNGFYEKRPLPYAETAYGNPESGESMINVTNGKIMRLLVDDEPFDLRYGTVEHHERTLDLRAGVLRREVRWLSPAGQGVILRSTRLVSFAQRAIAAIHYEVQPYGRPARIVVQSELVANEPVPDVGEDDADPRAAAALRSPLIGEAHDHNGLRAGLVHITRASRLRLAAGMDHLVDGPDGTVTAAECHPDLARVTVATDLQVGQRLRIVKFLGYGWSSRRSLPAIRDQVDAALAAALHTGWDGLVEEQREYLDDFWASADVEVDGDPALQQAIRFALFHVLQSAARSEGRAIPAKGLTGRGYDGHSFWDMETYTLPVLTYVAPSAARDALLWRHSTLDLARARARELSLEGAAFPWRTISGHECSGYWPAGTAAFHINADIADATRRYLVATDDETFENGPALDLLVETARLWRSLGHHDPQGGFRIDGVTGPDEYSALTDNNVYTNVMARRNLRAAAALASRHPRAAAHLGVGEEETAAWRDAAEAIVLPYDDELRITPQSEGFTRHRRWDFASTAPEQYPLLLHVHNYLLYSSQVVKQADLVFALYVCGDCFSDEQRARDFEYYESITVRDSSLSACVQAIMAAEVGHTDLAYDYLGETAFIDLRDLAFNTRDGIHLAANAGCWLVAVAGFGGMRDHDSLLRFSPRLPSKLMRLSFRLIYRGRRLRVSVDRRQAHYELLDGDPLEITHHGEPLTVPAPGVVETRAIPPAPARARPEQPPGREPPLWHAKR
ncbi:MAG TPA: glycosyl hydrolase family 65 protein [Solirubrobacteraceae bacterium]|nr:glycosyl hydrolase family 65 protein [Solirubrobacteraceae bacterium]